MIKMSEEKKAMSKRELVREISHVTQLKPEVVNSVISALTDIIIREAVMTGKFILTNVFTINTHKRKARRQFNVNKDEYYEYPETKFLGIKLSKKIQGFHRWKQRTEYNQKHGLTQEDWQNREGPELPNSKK